MKYVIVWEWKETNVPDWQTSYVADSVASDSWTVGLADQKNNRFHILLMDITVLKMNDALYLPYYRKNVLFINEKFLLILYSIRQAGFSGLTP